MDVEQAEKALLEANQREASKEERLQLRAQLDAAVLEEEVKRQAVYYDVTEEVARQQIEQNEHERTNGLPRTLFRPGNVTDQQWETAKANWIANGGNA